jgi:DNA-binding CsgD family transcriptional regulator
MDIRDRPPAVESHAKPPEAAKRDELGLTPREREVLGWVARGKTNSEIAKLLWIAPATVRKHLENVFSKLGVGTRTAAVARFMGFADDERLARIRR